MDHTSSMLDQQGYMQAHVPYTRTHARAHTQICNIYCFSTATIIRERASKLRYTYIVCLVLLFVGLCMNDKLTLMDGVEHIITQIGYGINFAMFLCA
jgi:Pyruvate/2-oxoacid:ferredoxin oxidoreductase delta subunit